MKTEEYIIILVGVVAQQNQIVITYTSNAPESTTSIRLTYGNGQTIKTFLPLSKAERGVLYVATQGLMPGTYTCSIYDHNTEKDSKTVLIS